MKRINASFFAGFFLFQLPFVAKAEGPDPVAELGRCYLHDASGEPSLKVIVYGNTRTDEVLGARLQKDWPLAASGKYTSVAALQNNVIAFRPDSRSPIFELSNPRSLSWISSRMTLAQYSEAGETVSEEDLVCYDADIEATRIPTGLVFVEGFGTAHWGEAGENFPSDESLAIHRAAENALNKCKAELGLSTVNAELVGAHKLHFSWGFVSARGKYECKAIH